MIIADCSSTLFTDIALAIPSLILTLFSLYFIFQKVGRKVLVSFSVVSSILEAKRIDSVVLVNKKNKPVSIFSIQAVIDDEVIFEIEKFNAALVLKPLESIHIKTQPFSELYLDGKKWNLDVRPSNVKIFLITEHGLIKCKWISHKEPKAFSKYKKPVKSSYSFNGKLYTSDAKYALIYNENGKQRTAFIMGYGFIAGDWDFAKNHLSEEMLKTAETAKQTLISMGFEKLLGPLHVVSLWDDKNNPFKK